MNKKEDFLTIRPILEMKTYPGESWDMCQEGFILFVLSLFSVGYIGENELPDS